MAKVSPAPALFVQYQRDDLVTPVFNNGQLHKKEIFTISVSLQDRKSKATVLTGGFAFNIERFKFVNAAGREIA